MLDTARFTNFCCGKMWGLQSQLLKTLTLGSHGENYGASA